MSSNEDEVKYVLAPRDGVQIEAHRDGGISIIGSGGLEDPVVICIETQDVPKVIAALRASRSAFCISEAAERTFCVAISC